MHQHMRPYKRIRRALERGALDEVIDSIWSEEDLHHMDKKGREAVADLIADSEHFGRIIHELLEKGVTPDMNLGDAFTPMPLLRLCARRGDAEVARAALERGASVELVFEQGLQVMHEAALHDHADIIELLVAFGADVNVASADDDDGHSTPLHMAASRAAHDAARALLKHGADTEIANWRGATALVIAATEKDDEMVEILLEYDADPSAARNNGRTPLHEAAHQRATGIFARLIEAGADLDAPDEDGWPPLYHAIARGGSTEVELLLGAGAADDVPTQETVYSRGSTVPAGYMAMDVAQATGQDRIVEMLENWRRGDLEPVALQKVLQQEYGPA